MNPEPDEEHIGNRKKYGIGSGGRGCNPSRVSRGEFYVKEKERNKKVCCGKG